LHQKEYHLQRLNFCKEISLRTKKFPLLRIKLHFRAANFSFAQLAKRKSLGRSKPATNSQAQALQHTVWNVSTSNGKTSIVY
jgi:hypothetical protein